MHFKPSNHEAATAATISNCTGASPLGHAHANNLAGLMQPLKQLQTMVLVLERGAAANSSSSISVP